MVSVSKKMASIGQVSYRMKKAGIAHHYARHCNLGNQWCSLTFDIVRLTPHGEIGGGHLLPTVLHKDGRLGCKLDSGLGFCHDTHTHC